MFVVDTNVLVHAVDRASPWHEPCLEALNRWRSQTARWHVTWSIVYEFLKTVTHRSARRPLRFEQAFSFMEAVLASPGLRVLVETPAHATLLAELPRDLSGNAVHDAHIVALMREHGVRRIYTRDAGFRRYAELEVIDPALQNGSPGVAEPVARYRARSRRRR
ncbi:MAG: type II toxin-antitoxin system VapC family toxin [Anaeromyxobacter sp.]